MGKIIKCACGCGEIVDNTNKRYISKFKMGHNSRIDNPYSRPDVIEKLKHKSSIRWQDPAFKEKHSKSLKEYYSMHEHHTKNVPKSIEQKRKMSKTRIEWYENNPEKAKIKNEKSRITNIELGTHKNEKNPNWHNGISKIIVKRTLKPIIKNEIKHRDGFRCQQCFRHQSELDSPLLVHHIDFDKTNDAKNNLITICNNCHSQLSFSREKWIEYYKNAMLERGIYG